MRNILYSFALLVIFLVCSHFITENHANNTKQENPKAFNKNPAHPIETSLGNDTIAEENIIAFIE